ncbi:MAG TPA: SDR family NAD(P)-dependent oxidoreductase [Bryobacteraceae bacterium]|nr:SDR family NAD(P)-dependent oxidoreductase [Bryobacteraceae bacterium]
MQIRFDGKTVLITGGANGIGYAAGRAFSDAGARVFLLDLASEKPEQRAAEIGGKGIPIDVCDPQSIDAAFESSGTPDVVAINAGIAPMAAIEDTSEAMWRRMLDVNLSGAFFSLRAAARRMKPRRAGAIVLTASTNSYDGEASLIAYNASKAGLLGILHTACNELGPYGVRVNAVCPGLIHTRLTDPYYGQKEALREYFRHIPMGRGGSAEEVANAILFLASEAASFISGAALLVDGGQMACKYSLWNDGNAAFDTEANAWKLR